jgi:hypothetical protein
VGGALYFKRKGMYLSGFCHFSDKKEVIQMG